MHLRQYLAQTLHGGDVRQCAATANVEEVFALMKDDDSRVANHAAWVMTHLPKSADEWLQCHADELISHAISTNNEAQRRLTMTVLLRVEFSKDLLRTDFIDLCLMTAADPNQPAGLRSVSIKLAYRQCRHYPELLGELRETLLFIDTDTALPAVRHCRNKILQLCNLPQ